MLIQIKEFVDSKTCLECRLCCRFNHDVWKPHLLREETGFFAGLETGTDTCPLLEPAGHTCRKYSARPFECALYPFLIHKEKDKLCLALHLACPFIGEKLPSRELEAYKGLLLKYLLEPGNLKELKTNFSNFATYPSEEISIIGTLT